MTVVWDWISPFFVGFTVSFALVAAVVLARQRWPGLREHDTITPIAAFAVGAAAGAVGHWSAAFACVVAVVVSWAVGARWRFLHPPGAALLTVSAVLTVLTLAAIPVLAFTVVSSPITAFVVWVCFLFSLATLPFGLVSSFMSMQPLLRDAWSRYPHYPTQIPARLGPMVSVHVPTYNEPPDMVIATLEALARMNYKRFEVIVVDNNTKSPALWEPVQERCEQLGFLFFHVDNLPGAKAGALNYALARTHPQAELVAVVDADYQVTSDFLARVTGEFIRPDVGAVQARYDFREWEHSRWLTACHRNFTKGFPLDHVSRNELGASYPVGPMCVVRRSAVLQAGGWSETNVTEDWELGIRLAAHGYLTLQMQINVGKGLIPERFSGLTKQRFRCAYGPVQTVRQRLDLLLGRTPSKLTAAQRLVFFHHGASHITRAVGAVLPVPLAILLWFASTPNVVWPVSAVVVLVAGVLGGWINSALGRGLLHFFAGIPWRDIDRTRFVEKALMYTTVVASLSALFTTSTRWRPTSKFSTRPVGIKALNEAKAELVLAVVLTGAGVWGVFAAQETTQIIAAVLLILTAAPLWAAPVAALRADRALRPEETDEPPKRDFPMRWKITKDSKTSL